MFSSQTMMLAALLVGGMGVVLLGSVKIPLARRLRIDEARVGGLVSIFGFIGIPVNLTAGFLTDSLGTQAVFLAGSFLLAVSVALVAHARSYLLVLLAIVILGSGWALLMNASNVLIPSVFGLDERGQINMPYAMNLANVYFGVGAFLTPLVLGFVMRRLGFRSSVSLLAMLALAPLILAWRVDFDAVGKLVNAAAGTSSQAGAGPAALFADPVIWLCGFAMFFYGPLEASMGAWATTLLGHRGIPEGTASNLLAAFWLSFLASRLATALFLPAGIETRFMLVLAILCVVVLLGVVGSRNAMTTVLAVIASGLVFGPVFPTNMAILLGHFPVEVHGRAVGTLFAIGGIGWTTIPILIGAWAGRASLQRAFSIAVAAAVGLCVVAAVLALS